MRRNLLWLKMKKKRLSCLRWRERPSRVSLADAPMALVAPAARKPCSEISLARSTRCAGAPALPQAGRAAAARRACAEARGRRRFVSLRRTPPTLFRLGFGGGQHRAPRGINMTCPECLTSKVTPITASRARRWSRRLRRAVALGGDYLVEGDPNWRKAYSRGGARGRSRGRTTRWSRRTSRRMRELEAGRGGAAAAGTARGGAGGAPTGSFGDLDMAPIGPKGGRTPPPPPRVVRSRRFERR